MLLRYRNFLVALLPILLWGCGSVSGSLFQPGFSAAYDDESGSVGITRRTQQVKISQGDASLDMLGVLETSQHKTSLVVLSLTGILLFSIEQTRETASIQRYPDIPEQLDPLQILADVRLINWETSALKHSLAPGVRLEESDRDRKLIRDGKVVSLASFTPNLQQWRKAVLVKHGFNYQLEVVPLSTEEL